MTASDIIYMTVIGLFITLWAYEYRHARRLARIARKAVDGWNASNELHLKDRQTFAGVQALADYWPDTIEK